MAKIYGLGGRISGKKGDAVFAVRKGVQTVRQYNPIVSNPRSAAQTDQRAKIKLLSQLGAVFGDVLTMYPETGKTDRNIFAKKNYDKISIEHGKAIADLTSIQLTNSSKNMAPVIMNVEQTGTTLELAYGMANQLDAVRYILVAVDQDYQMHLCYDAVEETAGVDGKFSHEIANYHQITSGQTCVCYAYGFKMTEAKARDTFGNMAAITGTTNVGLEYARNVAKGNAIVTETVADSEVIA